MVFDSATTELKIEDLCEDILNLDLNNNESKNKDVEEMIGSFVLPLTGETNRISFIKQCPVYLKSDYICCSLVYFDYSVLFCNTILARM